MRKTQLQCRMKPYIQPFERQLAVLELHALSGCTPEMQCASVCPNTYAVHTRVPAQQLRERLAYWETVGSDGAYCRQVYRESSSALSNNGKSTRVLASVRGPDALSLPRKRCLRYGPHGLHEYRGKFFPQLVRSLLNYAGTTEASVIADPMCGSGTSIVEGSLLGATSLGLDMNPLSCLVSRVKSRSLRLPTNQLVTAFEQLEIQLADSSKPFSSHFATLSECDQVYLRKWLAPSVIGHLDRVMDAILKLKPATIQEFYTVVVSNLIRRVSWQKNDDLRVRRDEGKPAVDVFAAFLSDARRATSSVIAMHQYLRKRALGSVVVSQGDARELRSCWGDWAGRVDTIVTSPPYAMALPYLDTDRLSLCYLNLLRRTDHRAYDLEMIGNREITEGLRREYWAHLEENSGIVPPTISDLVKQIACKNEDNGVGFRRKNLPSLLVKYFVDMRRVFSQMHSLLRRGPGQAFVVVGSNHTIAGGRRVKIETAEFLSEIAVLEGFKLEQAISMEMLPSRDIFRQNASDSETILFLRKV